MDCKATLRNAVGALCLGALGCWQAHAGAGTCAIEGQPLHGVLEGDLGSPPAGSYAEILCLEVANDQPATRFAVAGSSVPLPHSLNLTDVANLAVVGPGDQHVAAQFDVVSRWGGVVDNVNLPIRWLEISLPSRVAPNSINRYALRRYQSAPAVSDPFELTVTQADAIVTVDSGLATFELDVDNPRLMQSISVDLDDDGSGRTVIYRDAPEAGPKLVFTVGAEAFRIGGDDSGTGDPDRIFASSFEPPPPSLAQGEVILDPGGFEIVRRGPVKTTLVSRGHFVADGGESRCNVATAAPYERFGYTAEVTLYRGQRDVDLRFEFRNECSDALTGPWIDDVATIREVSWSMPWLGSAVNHVVSTDALTRVGANSGLPSSVAQHKGSGAGASWSRRAQTRLADIAVDTRAFYEASLAGLQNNQVVATVQMPWMKYREPQRVWVGNNRTVASFVSEDVIVGEGKGIWNVARFAVAPAAQVAGGLSGAAQSMRERGQLDLERGLLVRADLADINASMVYPSLGTARSSTVKGNYEAWLDLLHRETVDPGGQWDRNKNYGSQYWPDTGSNDPFQVDADRPNDSSAGMNYWDPAGIEALEFLRTGQPRWAWDLALPAYWTQAHAAYLNIGDQRHGNRAGVAVQSGGPGCELVFDSQLGFYVPSDCTADGTGGGQWHRSGQGSDDYTYAMSLELAYVLQPNAALRDRFRQAGATVIDRYDPSIPEANREDFVSVVNNSRQVIQHLEMLANCAEFVPGVDGLACDTQLRTMMNELSRDNLAPGLICQGFAGLTPEMSNADILGPPAALPTRCVTPQQFMINALMYQLYYRVWRNYGDPTDGSIRRMLVEYPQTLYDRAIAKDGAGDILPNGDWYSVTDCALTANGTAVDSCQPARDSDGNFFMYGSNKPHTAALLLISDSIDGSAGLCQRVRTLFDVDDFTGSPDSGGLWNDVGHFNQAGWWKATSQMLQGMVFGVGLYDTCGP